MNQEEIIALFERTDPLLLSGRDKNDSVERFVFSNDKNIDLYLMIISRSNLLNLEEKYWGYYPYLLANRKTATHGLFVSVDPYGAYSLENGVLTLKTQLARNYAEKSSLMSVELGTNPMCEFTGSIEVTLAGKLQPKEQVYISNIDKNSLKDKLFVKTIREYLDTQKQIQQFQHMEE